MKPTELQIGSVVQLNPNACRNLNFGAAFMVVTDPKPWGAQGYVQVLGSNEMPGGLAFYRANWEEMELIGMAEWISR